MPWFTIIAMILPLIEMLIKWIQNRPNLNTRMQTRLNHLLSRCAELRSHATRMGCKPDGEEDPNEVRTTTMMLADEE